QKDVEEMIGEIKGKILIRGFRGKPPLDEKSFIQTLLKIGQLGIDAAGLYESMDFNPLLLTRQETVALDAKVILTKDAMEAVKSRFKNPEDPLKMVIVRDMWLTGFDAPCAHTMYVDKIMKGHNLMQAIARVNRVF
ncbi:hypothetical protein LCGC14_2086380, partial [marine sediment metagenome]